MTMATALRTDVVTSPCEACGELVIKARKLGGAPINLEPELARGALWLFDPISGVAQRRSLVDVYRDRERSTPVLARWDHDCPGPRQWYQRD